MALSLIATAIGVGFVLAESQTHRLSTSYLPANRPGVKLVGSQKHCQGAQTVPEGAAAVRLFVATFAQPVPALAVEVTDANSSVTSGSRHAGGREGPVTVALATPPNRTTTEATVCVSVDVPGQRRTQVLGAAGMVRLEWLPAKSESWFGFLPELTDRFSYGKANPFGRALLAVPVILMLAALALGCRFFLRSARC